MTREEEADVMNIKDILKNHSKWFHGKVGGKRANLYGADAMRSSATSRKCRASKARVISITDLDGNPAGDNVASDYDRNFVYRTGETVEVSNFDTNRWIECAPGIHHYITREEAVRGE